MKSIETIIFVLLFLYTLSLFIQKLRKISQSLLFSALFIFVIIIHFVFEGFRWQITLAYILSIVIILSNFIYFMRRKDSGAKDSNLIVLLSVKIIIALWIILLMASLSLPILFPAFELPKPTGQYAVGTTSLSFTDSDRKEIYTSNPDDSRFIFVRIWYPAKVSADDKPVPYMKTDEYKAVARFESMPSLLYSDLPLVKSHSYRNADLPENNEIFPILFFSHGAGGNILTHTTLMEELASHGYIVFNIAHPYQTAFARDDEGHIIHYDHQHVDKVICEATSERIEKLKDKILSTNDLTLREELYQELIQLSPQTLTAVQVRTGDIISVINNVKNLNFVINNFTSKLDTSKIGVFGFSLGGATAARACFSDKRIKSGINIDGIMVGDFKEMTLSVPFMFITSEQMAMTIDGRIRDQFHEIFYDKTEDIAYTLAIKNTTHANLSDWSLFGGLSKYSGVLGEIDGYRCTEILRLYVRSFFDKHLKGKEIKILSGQFSQYPEVQLQYRDLMEN